MNGSGDVTRVVLRGRSTPHALEQLRLELRRLARQHGVELTGFEVEPDEASMDLLI